MCKVCENFFFRNLREWKYMTCFSTAQKFLLLCSPAFNFIALLFVYDAILPWRKIKK